MQEDESVAEKEPIFMVEFEDILLRAAEEADRRTVFQLVV